MARIDMMGDAPVGAIVPFFGKVPDSMVDAGWLVCDGRSLLQNEWPDLSAAIGQAFGFVGQDSFCLPDLRGVFLRTIDAGAKRDPGVDGREGSGPAKTGNAGDKIGSIQNDATRSPREAAFSIEGKFGMGHVRTHDGCSDSNRIRYKSGATAIAFHGGDAESRPVNLDGIYLIKAKPNSKTDAAVGQVPIGAAISLPFKPGEDTPVDDFWRQCDGQTFIAAEGSTFWPLYKMLGLANGGVTDEAGNAQRFAIPDLRGLFVRGVAGDREGAQFDPDRDKRAAPRPDLKTPGDAGNHVGSYENWSTAAPKTAAFSASIPSYPFTSTSGYQSGAATAAAHQGNPASFSVNGGDAETRPISMAVDWFVRFMASGGGQRNPGDELPLGTVIAAGTAEELAKWRPCHGQPLLITDYEALYKVLGTTFGGDGKTTFCLPDMRGRFLRGAGDPRAGYPMPRGTPSAEAGAVQEDATGAPTNTFTVEVANWPGDSTSDVIDYGTGTELLKLDSQKTIKASDGDDETRPINVYVQHLIKVLL